MLEYTRMVDAGTTVHIHGLTGTLISVNDTGWMALIQFDGYKAWKPTLFMQFERPAVA